MGNYLIAGSGSGIGYSIAKELTESGNTVFGISRNIGNASELDNYKHIELDLTHSDEIELESQLPELLNGLVYAPGNINLKPFHRLKGDDFRNDFELNLVGAANLIRNSLKMLKAAEKASIIMFSTVAVQTGMAFHASTAAAKGAVEGLVRSLAAELAPKIRVNAIAPSITDTPLAEKLLNTDSKRKASSERHPLQRYGKSEDISKAALFLLGEDSSWITGQIIHVDGGLSSLR